MNLTKRDKFLIYVCVLFAMCSLTYMLVISKNTKEIRSLESERDSQMYLSDEISFANANFEFAKDSFSEYSDEYNSYVNGFFELNSANESISEYFTNQMLEHGLVPYSFAVSEGYSSSKNRTLSDSEQYYTPYFSRSFPELEGHETSSMFIDPRQVDITFSGSYEDITSFIDFVNSQNGLFIKDIAFSVRNDGYEDEYGTALTGSYMDSTMSLVAFFYDKEAFGEYLENPGLYDDETED